MAGREASEKEILAVERELEGKETINPLERIANALEKLAADPEVEIEVGPPICPHCGKLDPIVQLAEQEASRGPMSQLIVDGVCTECGHQLFIVIESYSVHRNRTTAGSEINERDRIGFFNQGAEKT